MGGSSQAARDHFERLKGLGYTRDLLVAMAAHSGGGATLAAVAQHAGALAAAKVPVAQTARVVAHDFGHANLLAIMDDLTGTPTHGWFATPQQLITLASHTGGAENVRATAAHLAEMRQAGFTTEQVLRMASHEGGAKNLACAADVCRAFVAVGYTLERVAQLVSKKDGWQALTDANGELEKDRAVLQELGFNLVQISRMVKSTGGVKNLVAMLDNLRSLQVVGCRI